MFIYVSDHVWLVVMDPHSLVPPCSVIGGEAVGNDVCSVLQGDYSSTPATEGSGQSLVSVQGRLRNCIGFWESWKHQILCWELSALDIDCLLLDSRMSNHRSALESSAFVSNVIQELPLAKCVVECTECPLVCSPLQVATNATGKQRLVIDLRYVNQYLCTCKFKYEGLNILPSLFKRGDYLIWSLATTIHQDCWFFMEWYQWL